jgi:hypothetical protein
MLDFAPPNMTAAYAECWILIDGKVRYHAILTPEHTETVGIEIADNDRFLTLIATDGGSRDPQLDRNAIGYDWCIFGQPKLALE